MVLDFGDAVAGVVESLQASRGGMDEFRPAVGEVGPALQVSGLLQVIDES